MYCSYHKEVVLLFLMLIALTYTQYTQQIGKICLYEHLYLTDYYSYIARTIKFVDNLS